MASRFEATPNNKKGQQLVVVKTLHEMVHWARFNFFRLSPRKVKLESRMRELGDAFEIKVYRRVLQMRDNEWWAKVRCQGKIDSQWHELASLQMSNKSPDFKDPRNKDDLN
jgi:hypothetical protein